MLQITLLWKTVKLNFMVKTLKDEKRMLVKAGKILTTGAVSLECFDRFESSL